MVTLNIFIIISMASCNQLGTTCILFSCCNVTCTCGQLQVFEYGTAQLQGNVHTCTEGASHMFQMCPACILDASHIWHKRVWQLIKCCCSFIVRFCACMDASHSGWISHVLDTPSTHSEHIRMLPLS